MGDVRVPQVEYDLALRRDLSKIIIIIARHNITFQVENNLALRRDLGKIIIAMHMFQVENKLPLRRNFP